jgi:hypothetical protein
MVSTAWHRGLNGSGRRQQGPVAGWPPEDISVWTSEANRTHVGKQEAGPLNLEALDSIAHTLRDAAQGSADPGRLSASLATVEGWSQSLAVSAGIYGAQCSPVGRFIHSSQRLLEAVRLSYDLRGGSHSLMSVLDRAIRLTVPAFMREALLEALHRPSGGSSVAASLALIQKAELSLDVALMLLEQEGHGKIVDVHVPRMILLTHQTITNIFIRIWAGTAHVFSDVCLWLSRWDPARAPRRRGARADMYLHVFRTDNICSCDHKRKRSIVTTQAQHITVKVFMCVAFACIFPYTFFIHIRCKHICT